VTAGIDEESVEQALATIDDERQRAEELVARRGASPKTARYLAGKGFSEDVVHAAIARSRHETLG
jgi:SOS response regulatory protein OraA/RecX